MEQIPCVNCGKFFIPRNRSQNYCTDPDCMRARKAAWQRYKMKTYWPKMPLDFSSK